MTCVWCRERGLCDKAERELEGVRLELSAMHEAMASLHGEMGAMQREVRHPSFVSPAPPVTLFPHLLPLGRRCTW